MKQELLQGDGFSVRLENRGRYLWAHVFGGTDSLAVSLAMWKLLARQCQRFNARGLLVLEDLASTVEPENIAAVIEAMTTFGFADIRIAFVELQGDIEGSERGEILALENDILVHVFGNETEARRWLLYGGE